MDVSHLSVDVSLWDGYDINGNLVTVDWKQTGYPIALIKSSQRHYADPVFKAQWAAAKGLPRVAYHMFDASYNAIQQANDCWNVIKQDWTDTDYLAIDFETLVVKINGVSTVVTPPTPESLKRLGSMLYEMEKVIPVDRIFIYTGSSFWYPCGGKAANWAAKYRLWQAQWPWDKWLLNVIPLPPKVWNEFFLTEKVALIASGKARPVECLPWTNPDIWQFTAKMNPKLIPTYKANKVAVDLNYVYMDLGQTPPQYVECPTCKGTGQVLKYYDDEGNILSNPGS